MNRIFISAVIGALVLAGLMVFQATQADSTAVVLPSVLVEPGAPAERNRIRVAGRVSKAEILYSVTPKFELRFSIDNPGSVASDHGLLNVVYQGIKPDMFASGRDVIIDGNFKNGSLEATKLLTQCPSKYEAPKPTDRYPGGLVETAPGAKKAD